MIASSAPALRPLRRLAVVVATVLAVVAGVLASGASPAAAAVANAGSGQLNFTATGPAVLDVQGRFAVLGVLPLPSKLEVRGKQGTFTVRVNGVLQKPKKGAVRVPAAAGRIFVQSSTVIRLRVEGPDLALAIAGRAQAVLQGQAMYTLNGEPEQAWPTPPTPVLIQPTARRRPAQPPAPPPPPPPATTGGTTTTTPTP